jgi:hypothetical protein
MTNPISSLWLEHLAGQFEKARPILFTGAGFSLGVKNVLGYELPTYSDLEQELWQICFPGAPFEDTSSLQDLYDEALRRHRTDLKKRMTQLLTTNPDSLQDWYETIFSFPWQRCYTLNIDDVDQSVNRRFRLDRGLAPISAVSDPASTSHPDPFRNLQVVHLNGTLEDIPEGVTFSVSQYADRLSRKEPWYMTFVADLLTSPVVFIGTRLDEPPLWQHLMMRHGPGTRQMRELRHRSYLVTPKLDRAKEALLTDFNVVWVPMTAEEFTTSVLAKLHSSAAAGRKLLSSKAVTTVTSATAVPEVAELARNPTKESDFLLGSEPIWADVQSGRAIVRECDAAVWTTIETSLKATGIRGAVTITGTGGSGKSTSLMRACLRLVAEGVGVGWVDRSSDFSPGQIRAWMRADSAPPVLAIDDADMFGSELSKLVRDLALGGSRPLVIIEVSASRMDHVINPVIMAGIPNPEIAMPPLADADIGALIDLLDREKRLGILTGKDRSVQEKAFREQAGRQLLVAMIKATSGKQLEEKALEELEELDDDAKPLYAFIAVATAFGFGLTRDEILIASRDASNTALNSVDKLVRRHLVTERTDGYIWARHSVIAEIIRTKIQQTGQIGAAFSGLTLVGAAKVTKNLTRSARPWRMLKAFLNHDMLVRTVGIEYSRNLYGALEDILNWDFHFWLQRGSLEVEFGDLNLAERFLNTAKGLSADDPYVENEYAYLLFRQAIENPLAVEAPELVKQATAKLEYLISGDLQSHYPYHVLGSQALAWARCGIASSLEKEPYLRKIIGRVEDGIRKYPRRSELEVLLNDIKKEYMNIAVVRRAPAPPGVGDPS